jgi:hypothetical protein
MKMPGEDIPARAIAGKVLQRPDVGRRDLPAHMVFNGRDHVCPLALPAVLVGCLARAAGIDRSRKFARLACGVEREEREGQCTKAKQQHNLKVGVDSAVSIASFGSSTSTMLPGRADLKNASWAAGPAKRPAASALKKSQAVRIASGPRNEFTHIFLR